MAALNKNWETA